MRDIYGLSIQGRTLLPEAERLTRSELIKLLFSTGWKGTGTQQLIQLAEDCFFIGVAVARKEGERMTTAEFNEVKKELQEKPELMRLLKAFSDVPEELKPAALEDVLNLLQRKQ